MWKKLGKALLFPHGAILVLLLPVATLFLIYAMAVLGTENAVSYVSYVLAAYTLTVWCVRILAIVRGVKRFRAQNKFARRWLADERLRVKVSLYASQGWNVAYAVLQLCLGLRHHSFWFYSMAGYYLSLAVMRLSLARYTARHGTGEDRRAEFYRYRACGWVFLLMNLALSLMIFFMVYWNRTFHHHEITAIALAAYTFTALTAAIVGTVRYRRYNSPVYSASRAISLAAACVSMLTLESTLLTTFGDGSVTPLMRRLMLGISGGAVSLLILLMAIAMIVRGTKALRSLRKEV